MDWSKRLSNLYNLNEFHQDWGICNADNSRVSEFIKIFLNHEAVDPWEWEELADLVFESANGLMREGKLTKDQEKALIDIVLNHRHKFPEQFEYWLEYGDYESSPIKRIIERGKE